MKILVTSSTGMTGRAVVKALNDTGAFVRAMIHSDRHNSEMVSIGASETVVASIENEADIKKAMEGWMRYFISVPRHIRKKEKSDVWLLTLLNMRG